MKEAAQALIDLFASTNQIVMWDQYTFTLADGSQLSYGGNRVTPAWWEFEEVTGQSYVDLTGNGNDLSIVGASAANLSISPAINELGHYRGGFNQPSRLIFVPRSNRQLDYGPSLSFSIGTWVNRRSSMGGALMTRVIFGRNGIEQGYSLVYANDGTSNAYFEYMQPSSVQRRSGSLSVPLSSWAFLVGVVDMVSRTMFFSVNAVQSSITDVTAGVFSGGNQNFVVGQPLANNSTSGTNINERQFDGYFDASFITPRALTMAEISWLYNGGTGRTYAQAHAAGLI